MNRLTDKLQKLLELQIETINRILCRMCGYKIFGNPKELSSKYSHIAALLLKSCFLGSSGTPDKPFLKDG